MRKREGPSIHLETDTGAEVEIVLVHSDGTEERLPKRTPVEELIGFVERDYSTYRSKVKKLWDEHPLFDERIDIPYSDYEDLVSEAVLLPAELKEIDPIAFFVLGARLDAALQIPDDGSATFLLESGTRILRILEEPFRTQVRLRNLFEVAFDDHERGTQRDRFDAVEKVWPGILDRFVDVRYLPTTEGDIPIGSRRDYSPSSLYELYLIELQQYFQQANDRVARCEHCWNYFVPKTKKETLYCDRVFDGSSCKQIGPNRKRKVGPEQDAALEVYAKLRKRMWERMERYESSAPQQRERKIEMDIFRYGEWSDMAQAARMDYLNGNLSAEEFLKRIDVNGELVHHVPAKKNAVAMRDSAWRRRVNSNIEFDPHSMFSDFQLLDLRKGAAAQWEIFTPDEQIRMERGGNESLRKKYGPSDPNKEDPDDHD